MLRKALFALIAIGLVACGGDSVTEPTAAPLPPANPDRDGDGFLNAADACPDQAEVINLWLDDDGCPDNTSEFYGFVKESLDSYWGAVFEAIPSHTYMPISIFQAYQVTATTPCGDAPSNNAIYCAFNAGVYYHQPFLDSFWQNSGDASPAYIIGHEIGHHVGFLLGWFNPAWSQALSWIPHTLISTKESELMADCFSGVWMAWVEAAGLLDPGDLEEVVVAIVAVADADDTWFDPTKHGTYQQRVTAFAIGFHQGASFCTAQTFFDLFPAPAR